MKLRLKKKNFKEKNFLLDIYLILGYIYTEPLSWSGEADKEQNMKKVPENKEKSPVLTRKRTGFLFL